jgi:hypothetical protein
MIASHGTATALPHLLPAHRLARTAGPRASVQERRAPRAPARGGGAAPADNPATPLLARPRRALSADPAATQAAPTLSARDAGDAAALASAAAQAALDQAPPPARSTGDPHPATAVDPADGSGEPHLGLPAHPRRTHPARVHGRAKYRVAAPQPSRHRSGATPCGANLAAVPPRPGQERASGGLLHRRHGVVAAAVRAVRAGACHPPGCTSSA